MQHDIPRVFRIVPAAILLFLAAAPLSQAGFLVRWQYLDTFDASGARTTNWRELLANPAVFPAAPSASETLAVQAATATNIADDYGSLIRGYVVAPMDGNYTFTVGSDDSSALWLSSNHSVPADFPSKNPGNPRAPDAEETGWSSQGIFGAQRLDVRTTDPVALKKGDVRYFEMVSQEGGGGDFMQLGWTRPDGEQEIVPGLHLMPWTADGTALAWANGQPNGVDSVNPISGPDNQTVGESASVTFKADVFGGRQPVKFQWRQNGADISGATLSYFTIDRASLASNGGRFDVVATDAAGAAVTSKAATLTVQPDTAGPKLILARGSGWPYGIIVKFSEEVDAASATDKNNYQITGQTLTIESVTALNSAEVLLKVAPFTTDPMTLTVSNVKDVSAAGNVIAAVSKAVIGIHSNLAGYWSFNEGDGSAAIDAARGNTGALLNDPVWVADAPTLGRPNPFALQFDGVDDYVQTTYAGVAGTNPRVVSFWVKADENSLNTHGIVAWGNSTANTRKYHVRLETSTGTVRTEAQGGNNWGSIPVNDGLWHHVVSRLPAGVPARNFEVLHYIDGVLDERLGGADVGIDTDVTSASAIPVRIGGRDQTGTLQAFPGFLDEVAIFDGDLTPEQIAQLAKGADPFQFASPLAATIVVSQQPADVRIFELDTATFSVTASGSPVIGYQWFKNDQLISGAEESSYTTPPASPEDNGSKFQVEVFNTDGSFNRITSGTATLTVVTDRQPPKIVRIRGVGLGLNRVVVEFDESVDAASASDSANYKIEGVNITSATLDPSGTIVTLATGTLNEGNSYSLTISGVKDLVSVPNVLNTTAPFKAAAIYGDQVLLDQPDLYLPLGEKSGTTVLDIIGKDPGFVGTFNSIGVGAVPVVSVERLVPGTLDGALKFSSANSTVVGFTDSSFVNTTGPFEDRTIELWFRADQLPGFPSTATLPQKKVLFEEGGTTRGISMYLSGTQDSAAPTEAELYFHAWNDATDGTGSPWGGPEEEGKAPVIVKTTVQPNKVYHVVLVLDGDNSDALAGRLDGYVNGQKINMPQGENLLVGMLYAHGDNSGLGAVNQNGAYHDQNRSTANGDYFDGVIDELAIYNRALTAERVLAHYNQGLKAVETPPQEIRVTSAKVSSGNITIEWSGGGVLQSAPSVNGPFTTNTGSTSPFTEAVSGQAKFYRVTQAP